MFLRIFCVCILSLLICVCAEIDQSDWIDPHDMSPVYNKDFFPYDIELEATNLPKEKCDQTESQSKSYLKRTINMILNAVHEDAINDRLYKGHLIFEIDVDKFARLHEFTSNKFDDLHEIDIILSEILKKPSHAYLKEYFLSWFYKTMKMITSRAGIAVMIIVCYLFVVYKLMKGNFNYWYILKFLFINMLIFDFVFVWIRLHQKAEIDKMVNTIKFKNAPDYCNPNTMTTLQFIYNALGTVDKCKEYHYVTLTDIFWNVSPSDVLIEIVTNWITTPMKSIGPAVGQFIYGIYGSLPFGVNIILLPAVLIFVMIMTCILLSFILGIPIKFNFFHLISFSFGDNVQQTNGNVLTGRSVEQLLDIVKDNNTPRYLIKTNTNVPATSINQNIITEKKEVPQIIEKKSIECNAEKQETDDDKSNEEDCEKVADIDVIKCGYEPDIIEPDSEIKINDEGVRKRKREEGSGDM